MKATIPGLPLHQSLKTLLFLLVTTLGIVLSPFSSLPARETLSSPTAQVLGQGEYSDFRVGGDIRRFAGETLLYDISFLWFKKAAQARVTFRKTSSGYESVLVAETKGFVGWFTSYRKHIYKASFDVIDNGKRVRTRVFEREVIIGDDVETSINTMDYIKKENRYKIFKNDELFEQGLEEIPPGIIFDDVLASFYNFRNSVYGPIKKGKEYLIYTIPEKGMKEITVNINSSEQQELERMEQQRQPADEYLLRVKIPKEVFKTKSGILLFWASRHLIPLETTVKDYILLGDLHAKFVRRETE